MKEYLRCIGESSNFGLPGTQSCAIVNINYWLSNSPLWTKKIHGRLVVIVGNQITLGLTERQFAAV